MSKLLTIGIPTYNRSSKLAKLLYFLEDEIYASNCESAVEVIVSDNCSSDNTESVVENYIQQNQCKYIFKYNRNDKNLGLVNNVLKIYEFAEGNYVWVMGDDDIYHSGIIAKVLSEVKKNIYSFIFINHCLYENFKGDETYIPTMLNGVNPERTDKEVLLDITERSGTCLMYISATILKMSAFNELKNYKFEINLAYPLFMSFFAASIGKTKIIPEVLIDDVCAVTSWDAKATQVFCNLVPKVLRELPKIGYSERWVQTYKQHMKRRGEKYSLISFIKKSISNPRWAAASFLKHTYRLKNLIQLFD